MSTFRVHLLSISFDEDVQIQVNEIQPSQKSFKETKFIFDKDLAIWKSIELLRNWTIQEKSYNKIFI